MRYIFIIVFSIISISINAQFKTDQNGLSLIDGNSYYVVTIENKTAHQLYLGVINYVMSTFKNPNIVMSKEDDTIITIHGIYEKSFITSHAFKEYIYGNIDMNIVIHFKDNKIRIDIPTINRIYNTYKNNNGDYVYDFYFYRERDFFDFYDIKKKCKISIYNKTGKIKNKYADRSIKEFINKEISTIIEYAKGNSINNKYINDDW